MQSHLPGRVVALATLLLLAGACAPVTPTSAPLAPPTSTAAAAAMPAQPAATAAPMPTAEPVTTAAPVATAAPAEAATPAAAPAASQAPATRVAPGLQAPTATPAASAAGDQASFTDPFAYCAAVGTIDAPDARYSGPKMPPAVTAGLMQAMNLPPGTPPPPIAQNSFWRCMDGKVYACTVGANLPCQEKGKGDKTPTQAMNDYCQANPNSDFIPMVVTGRATVYAWKCSGATAAVDKQVTQVDKQGFLASIWYEIKP